MTATATATDSTPRLLLLDGHSLAYRAFFALPVENFSTTTGQPTNAVYGFTSMLINIAARRAAHAPRGRLRRRPARPSAARSSPSTRPTAPRRPTDFRGQVEPDPGGARRAARPGASPPRATRPTTSSPRSPSRRRAGHGRADRHRRPRRLQLVNDHVTVLYPRKGVSDLTRFTPEEVEAKYGLTPGPVPRLRGAARRPERQPARHPGRRGEDRGQVDPRVRLARRSWSTGSTRSRARSARRCASTWPRCMRNRQLTELVRDVPLRRSAPATSPSSRGTATRCTALRHPAVPGAARPAVRRPWPAPSPRPTAGFDVAGDGARRRRAGRLAGRARRRRPHRVARPRHLGPRHRRASAALALAAADGAAACVDLDPSSTTPTSRRWPPGSPTRPRRRPCTTPRARCWRSAARGWELAGRHQRHRARRLPGACPGQRSFDLADLALRYLRRELARRRRPTTGQLTLDGGPSRTTAPRPRRPMRAGPRGPRPRRRARRRRSTGGGGDRAARATWSCR